MHVSADTVPWMCGADSQVMLRCNVDGETTVMYYLTDITPTYHGIAGQLTATGKLGAPDVERMMSPISSFFPWHNIISIHETQ